MVKMNGWQTAYSERMRNGCSSHSKWFQIPFEWPWKNFEQMMPAVQTAMEKFQTDGTSHSNG